MNHTPRPGDPGVISGRVTASFGRNYEVVIGFGSDAPEVLKCVPRGKKSVFACGDEVVIERTSPGQAVIAALAPRQNLLWRSDAFREKLIASNLSQIAVVVATEPGFSPLLISRCIVAAETQGLRTLIVLNKADIKDKIEAARRQLEAFRRLGYDIIELDALHDVGPLAARLSGERSILVGQSGMGKSTITNSLIPEADAATAEISTVLDSGKHTTTFARAYALQGGWLIDSPGMQAFGLAHVKPEELPEAFIEFRPHLGHCRFRDCRHTREPGCALLAATERGEIDALRFDHFHTIRDEIEHAGRQARGW